MSVRPPIAAQAQAVEVLVLPTEPAPLRSKVPRAWMVVAGLLVIGLVLLVIVTFFVLGVFGFKR